MSDKSLNKMEAPELSKLLRETEQHAQKIKAILAKKGHRICGSLLHLMPVPNLKKYLQWAETNFGEYSSTACAYRTAIATAMSREGRRQRREENRQKRAQELTTSA